MKMITEINRFVELTDEKQKACVIAFAWTLQLPPKRIGTLFSVVRISNAKIIIEQNDNNQRSLGLSKASLPIVKLLIKNYL